MEIEQKLKSLTDEGRELKNYIEAGISESPEVQTTSGYQELKPKILDIISRMKKISTVELSELLQCQESTAFLFCSQLRKENLIDFDEDFEWILL
jgi:hypothetical protein